MGKTISRLVLLAGVILITGEAVAMRYTHYHDFVAWSQDGTGVLLRTSVGGPEGGSSEGYTVINAAKGTTTSFAYSSTFSPGDGSQPQRVSENQANSVLDELRDTLAVLGFAGLKVRRLDDSGSAKDEVFPGFRGDPLEFVEDDKEKKAEPTEFTAQKDRLVLGPLALRKHKDRLLLIGQGQEVVLLDQAADVPLLKTESDIRPPAQAYLSPTGKTLLFILAEPQWQGNQVGPVFYSPTGKIRDFRPVELKNTRL